MKRFILGLALMGGSTLMTGQTTHYGSFAGTGGSQNSFFGYFAGYVTTGNFNSSVGAWSMRFNTTGEHNAALGYQALNGNHSGSRNIAIGSYALVYNDNTDDNVAIGHNALKFAESSNNTAVGSESMYGGAGVHTGYMNCAFGGKTLFRNKTGYQNIAIGYTAMLYNSSGSFNVASGFESMYSNTTGGSNTAVGYRTLHDNTTGDLNVALGSKSLWNNTDGRGNTGIGFEANNNNTGGDYNTGVGYRALRYNVLGNYNSGLGFGASTASGATYNYSTAIGTYSVVTASDQVRIGASWVGSIGGYKAWTNLSDGRFKKNVKEDVKGLAFINELRPVSYEVDHKAVNDFLGVELDEATAAHVSQGHSETGFIAQEVEATAQKVGFKRFSGVDAPKNDQDHYGLRYAEFVVPLVKSVQELSAQNEEQKALIQTQQAQIEALQAMMAQQQAQIEQLLQGRTTHSTAIPTLKGAHLGQNQPNPFHTATQVAVEIPNTAQQAWLQVSTLEGQQLFLQEIPARGQSTVTLEANALPAGIYLYSLIIDEQLVDTKRMVLTR